MESIAKASPRLAKDIKEVLNYQNNMIYIVKIIVDAYIQKKKEMVKMKKKINKNIIYSILISSGIVSGISSMFLSLFSLGRLSENVEKFSESVEEVSEQVDLITDEIERIDIELDIIEQTMNETEEVTESSIEQTLSKEDKIIQEYFDTTLTDVIKTSERENVEIYRESIIQAVSYLSDFIFFDYELLGIKFTDITTETKASAIVTYVEIDKRVEQMYPGYKDELGDKYDTIKQFFENLYEYNKKECVINYIESKDDASYSVKDKANVKIKNFNDLEIKR